MLKFYKTSKFFVVILTLAILAFFMQPFINLLAGVSSWGKLVAEFSLSQLTMAGAYELVVIFGLVMLSYFLCLVLSLANKPAAVIVFNSIAVFIIETYLIGNLIIDTLGYYFYGLNAITLFIGFNVVLSLIYFFAISMKKCKNWR